MKEQLKKQLLENIDAIVDIISKDNAVELRPNKDGIIIYEICRKKLNVKNKK